MGITDSDKRFDIHDADLHTPRDPGEHRGYEQHSRTAYDVKSLHDRYRELPDDVLKQIPVVDAGTRLEEGAIYLDLSDPEQGEFRGMNNVVVGPDECFVPKKLVDFELWNRLIGVRDRFRLGRMAS